MSMLAVRVHNSEKYRRQATIASPSPRFGNDALNKSKEGFRWLLSLGQVIKIRWFSAGLSQCGCLSERLNGVTLSKKKIKT